MILQISDEGKFVTKRLEESGLRNEEPGKIWRSSPGFEVFDIEF